ncbi:tetratricopeptide repeat protein [Streptomyces sp. MS06]|uniref:tetratricopeptide repeat protein n=1 Tax=Streptomyces sp. MS06 TaxID=3385974 RepID=UPI0039A19CBE
MSRLSRDEPETKPVAGPPVAPGAAAATPLDVHVPAAGPGTGGASIDGVPVLAPPGEDIQQVVLGELRRIAQAAGHPVQATIHDERLGCVVPLRVELDGSSTLVGDPRHAPPRTPAPRNTPPRTPAPPSTPAHAVGESASPSSRPTATGRALPEGPETSEGPETPAAPGAPGAAEPRPPLPEQPPGTAATSTGVFGPPPAMGAAPSPTYPPSAGSPRPHTAAGPAGGPASGTARETTTPHQPAATAGPGTGPRPHPASGAGADPAPLRAPVSGAGPDLTSLLAPALDAEQAAEARHTPPRGFDAVAEAVLGDDPAFGAEAPVALAEPMARISEAVASGRIEAAAELAGRTVAEASDTLGSDHREVLRLRELTAYIAYLSGEPTRAFDMSLELARVHRRAHDQEAAYGNVLSAATAWRAVRDPAHGLRLGRELLALWTRLAAVPGPAACESERLDSARARMTRLAERAARAERAAQAE